MTRTRARTTRRHAGHNHAGEILTAACRLVLSRAEMARQVAHPVTVHAITSYFLEVVELTLRTLAELWERTAREFSRHIAIISESESLSYQEVNDRANRLARVLVARGAGPERLVGLALPRSPQMVIGVLAAAKAGAAFLPVDTTYPAERVSFIVEDAAPVLLCTTQAAQAGLPPELPVPRLVLDAP